MASYNVVVNISNISSPILMVWRAKLVDSRLMVSGCFVRLIFICSIILFGALHCVNVAWKKWNLTLTIFFIFESRSKNKSCLFMSTMHRNDCPKIHRSQERPPRLLEGHSGDSCKVPLLMHIETWNSVYGFSNVYLEHSLCQRTYSTPVRNHRRPLRLLGGRFGDTLEKYHL